MKYSNGQEIKVGDKVKLWEGCYGTIACSMDANEYSEKFPKNKWGYLKVGIIIDSDKAGIIHYLEPNEDLELIERSAPER